MRFLSFFLFLLITVYASGQPADSAILIFPENSHDFGRITVDKGVVSHSFIFRNEGNIPLRITNIRSTCGCKISQWTTELVAPGMEGIITIEFDPAQKIGSFHKTIQVQSTASNANMFLTISGTVAPPIKKEVLKYKINELSVKTSHINFGYLYKGNTAVELLTFSNTTQKPIQIDFGTAPEYLQLKAIPSLVPPGEYGQIEIRYLTEKVDDWDVVMGQVTLCINGKSIDDSKLTVTANIREDFSKYTIDQLNIAPVAAYSNLSHNFDTIGDDKPAECHFLVKNNGQSDLIIRAVKPSCGCTAVKPEKSVIVPGDSTYIDAIFHPQERQGDFKSGITVVTNDPKLYKQYLWIEGYIKR